MNEENIRVPNRVKEIFERLLRSRSNRILSENSESDRVLFQTIEREEDDVKAYFAPLGFELIKGNSCYYFVEEASKAVKTSKLEALIDLVRTVHFFKSNLDSFGEGDVFSESELVGRVEANDKNHKVLKIGKNESIKDAVSSKIKELEDRGYLVMVDEKLRRFKVLSAMNYLQENIDRIKINHVEDA